MRKIVSKMIRKSFPIEKNDLVLRGHSTVVGPSRTEYRNAKREYLAGNLLIRDIQVPPC